MENKNELVYLKRVYFANYLFTSSQDGSLKKAQFEELVQKVHSFLGIILL